MTEVKRFIGGFLVVFDGPVAQPEAEKFMFPTGVPAGVEVVDHENREYALLHMTTDVASKLNPDVYTAMAEASVLTSGDDRPPAPDWVPGAKSNGTKPAAAAGPAVRLPGYPDPNDKEAVKKWLEDALEGTHDLGAVAEVAGFFAGEGSVLATVGEVAGGAGLVAGTIIVLIAVYEVFGEGLEFIKQLGYVYGLCWQAYGEPDHDHKIWALPPNTEEERVNAWAEGVADGRAKAQESKARNALILKAAQYMAAGEGQAFAERNVLNDIDQLVHKDDHVDLDWPRPHDEYPLGG